MERRLGEGAASRGDSAQLVLLLAMETTRITVTLSRSMEGIRGRRPSLEIFKTMDYLALVVVGAGDYRACIHLATRGRAQVEE